MNGMLRISDAASLALHAMALLAETPGEVLSAPKIAGTLDVSEAHLMKVMQQLHRSGLVDSVRGPSGGFVLAAGAKNKTLLDIYSAIEGEPAPATCLLGKSKCLRGGCILGNLLRTVDKEVRDHLSQTRLSQLAASIGTDQ